MRSFANLCCGEASREAMQHDSALMNEIKEDILNTPDDNEYGYFIECDLEYPAEIEKKTKTFHFVLIKQKQIQSVSQNT